MGPYATSNLEKSQRSSVSSQTSSIQHQPQTQKKGKWQRFLDEFKPIEVPITPAGIYSPLPKKQSISSENSSQRNSQWPQFYENFKVIVGGEKVNF